jgi:hypothetical protein
MLKSREISHVNVELKTNVSDVCSLYFIRVDVVNDCTSLYQSVMGIASGGINFCWVLSAQPFLVSSPAVLSS